MVDRLVWVSSDQDRGNIHLKTVYLHRAETRHFSFLEWILIHGLPVKAWYVARKNQAGFTSGLAQHQFERDL